MSPTLLTRRYAQDHAIWYAISVGLLSMRTFCKFCAQPCCKGCSLFKNLDGSSKIDVCPLLASSCILYDDFGNLGASCSQQSSCFLEDLATSIGWCALPSFSHHQRSAGASASLLLDQQSVQGKAAAELASSFGTSASVTEATVGRGLPVVASSIVNCPEGHHSLPSRKHGIFWLCCIIASAR